MARETSEFACEVVRVRAVEAHPNADRLEIVTFDMASGPTAYRVLDNKGKRRPGDLVAYLSVDALCPLDQERFAFLRERSKGKAKHRLKAAKLRGIYSEGLIVDAPPKAKLGDDLAEAWRVEKYEPPQERNRTGTQVGGVSSPTAKQWWKRPDLGGRFPIFEVLSLKKAPFTFRDGTPVEITEKVHGTNFRCGWIGGRWTVGSHRTVRLGDHRPWWRRALDFITGKGAKVAGPGFYKEDLYEAVAEPLRDKLSRYPDHVFYGEIFGYTPGGKKIQDLLYGTKPGETRLQFFAIFDVRSRRWLSPPMVKIALCALGLAQVPILASTEYSVEKIRELAEGPTTIGGGHTREGVVVRDIAGSAIAKWVGEGYRLRKSDEAEDVEAVA